MVEPRPKHVPTEFRSACAVLAFGAVFVLALSQHWALPEIVPADAPLSEGFSADRARDVIVDLSACGLKYIGSQANERCATQQVKRHILGAAGAYAGGVEVDIQSASGHFYIDFLGGLTSIYRNLTNVIARVKGRGGAGSAKCALLISSHFDSSYGSPAAADSNAEIAIMVELLRHLAHDPPPLDIIFNFNGGEEMLLQAAHGFITSHPWAADVCAVVNLEATGAGGRELLFQAGPRHRWIAETYGRRVARPFAHSITHVLFQTGIIPGDTDYRIYRDFGDLPGVDFAIISNDWVYHTFLDDVRHTDFRSIQRYGETVRSLVVGLAEELQHGVPVGPRAEEASVYFDVAGVWFVAYSAAAAQKAHIAVAVGTLTWVCCKPSRVGAARLTLLMAALLAGFLGAVLCATLAASALALSPAALVGSGHPEITPLLHVPPACLGFFGAFRRAAGDLGGEAGEDLGSASLALSALLCITLSSSSLGVLASYLFFLWTASPLLADLLCLALPASVGDVVRVAGFVLPWLILAQMLVLAFDLFCPLTMRSGTTVPGDVIIGLFYGGGIGLYASLSAGLALRLPLRHAKPALLTAWLLGLCLALAVFPYSQDRPKRIYMQHVARSAARWDLAPSAVQPVVPGTAPAWRFEPEEWLPMDSGIWMVAMDWNGVSTVERHAPLAAPRGGVVHDDSLGLYGEMPYPFPIKAFVANGLWIAAPAPELPVPLRLRVAPGPPRGADARELSFSIFGSTHIRLAIGPRHLVAGWSLGHSKAKAHDSRHAAPAVLPPARPDCDCYWLLFSEGGEEPSMGRAEALSFNLTVRTGELRLDLWSTHLEVESPEVKWHGSRMPHWVNFASWVSEVQVHKMAV